MTQKPKRRKPAGAERAGRGERARVSDTNPKHEGGDVNAPTYGCVESRDTDAQNHLPNPHSEEKPNTSGSDTEKYPPTLAWRGEHLEDVPIDVVKAMEIRVS